MLQKECVVWSTGFLMDELSKILTHNMHDMCCRSFKTDCQLYLPGQTAPHYFVLTAMHLRFIHIVVSSAPVEIKPPLATLAQHLQGGIWTASEQLRLSTSRLARRSLQRFALFRFQKVTSTWSHENHPRKTCSGRQTF
jgi:hypothetical protein